MRFADQTGKFDNSSRSSSRSSSSTSDRVHGCQRDTRTPVPFRFIRSDRALKEFKTCKSKQIGFLYNLTRIN
jgi:predicted transcriptional regulator